MNQEFHRLKQLPPYVFNIIDNLKSEFLHQGKELIDFGMGNPDSSTPQHIIASMNEALQSNGMQRYSVSRGIAPLRRAICQWYKDRYDVSLDPETEAIVTIGSKEGLAHLALTIVDAGDTVLVPNPSYPIHPYGFVIAGAGLLEIPVGNGSDFIAELEKTIIDAAGKPKVLLINFPHNPTTECVDLEFFEHIISIAKKHEIWVIQDIAYTDIVFDGYQAPSILQVSGAKDIAVEFFSLSKSYNMAGWRVGFMVGNQTLIAALARMKSYLDYGLFTPIQHAAVAALTGDQQCVSDICRTYQQRRDLLCDGLNAAGWSVTKPRGTMFIWAAIPEQFQHLGSLEFAKKLLIEAQVVVSPGIGFGKYGDQHVRFALVEEDPRVHQAVKSIATVLQAQNL